MIADALDDRQGAAVAHAEAFAPDPVEVDLARCGPVAGDVSDHDVLGGLEGRVGMRVHDQLARHGLSLEEIASVTGVGRETVKSRLRYAVAKLRAAVSWSGMYFMTMRAALPGRP